MSEFGVPARLDRWASVLRNRRLGEDEQMDVSTLLTEAANHIVLLQGELDEAVDNRDMWEEL